MSLRCHATRLQRPRQEERHLPAQQVVGRVRGGDGGALDDTEGGWLIDCIDCLWLGHTEIGEPGVRPDAVSTAEDRRL